MKSTTDQPGPSHEAEPTPPSPPYAIRFESTMTRFAELTPASGRAPFAVLESAAGVVLEQILLNLDFAVPDGSGPFRCETIAGTLARHNAGAEGEDAPRVRTADAPSTAVVVDRKSTRLNSSHVAISYPVFCLKKKIEPRRG